MNKNKVTPFWKTDDWKQAENGAVATLKHKRKKAEENSINVGVKIYHWNSPERKSTGMSRRAYRLVEKGWCQNRLAVDDKGGTLMWYELVNENSTHKKIAKYSAHGAIRVAYGLASNQDLAIWTGILVNAISEKHGNRFVRTTIGRGARQEVVPYIAKRGYKASENYLHIIQEWNDANTTTQEEVVDLMREWCV